MSDKPADRAAAGAAPAPRQTDRPTDRPSPQPPAATDPFGWLAAARAEREHAGLARALRHRPADSAPLDLAGNDYLGFARHPHVTGAAARAVHRWGAGATGSRLVTGSTRLHAELEAELAEFCGFEAALVFSSGYAANLAAVTALTGPDDLLVSDAGNHASLIDGCRLSRASTLVAPHADPGAVRSALADAGGRTLADAGSDRGSDGGSDPTGETSGARALAVTDSVFSVDGDAAPLPELAAACRDVTAGLLVDDAHGLGVLGPGGRGAVHAAGLAGDGGVIATVTLSKALGSQGGAVLGPARVIRHLIDTARTFIFDTGLAPAAAGAALASLRLLRREPERAARVRAFAVSLERRLASCGLATGGGPAAAVVSVRCDSPAAATRWAADCAAAGVQVGCFRPPSVPDGVPRLRLTVRADLTEDQLATAADVLARTAPHS